MQSHSEPLLLLECTRPAESPQCDSTLFNDRAQRVVRQDCHGNECTSDIVTLFLRLIIEFSGASKSNEQTSMFLSTLYVVRTA